LKNAVNKTEEKNVTTKRRKRRSAPFCTPNAEREKKKRSSLFI